MVTPNLLKITLYADSSSRHLRGCLCPDRPRASDQKVSTAPGRGVWDQHATNLTRPPQQAFAATVTFAGRRDGQPIRHGEAEKVRASTATTYFILRV